MASMYWPAEETFKYEFRKEYELSIPLIDNEKQVKRGRKRKEETGREEH